MSDMTIEVSQREDLGKNANRRLRASGQVPAVVYGGGRGSTAIQVDSKTIEALLRQEGGEHAVFLLKLAGTAKSRHTMIRDMQVDPITGGLIHIDFLRVNMDEEVRVEVAIEVQGTPEGVKTDGGILDFVTRAVEISCLPGSIPAHLDLDVSALHVGQHLEAGDLEMPEGVTLLSDADRVLVSVAGKQKEEVAEDEEEEGLLSSGAAEPEVVGQEE